MIYPEQRNLDGIYFRVERNGKWVNCCFTDLTTDEQQHVMEGRSDKWLRSLAVGLAETIRTIGDQFNIVVKED